MKQQLVMHITKLRKQLRGEVNFLCLKEIIVISRIYKVTELEEFTMYLNDFSTACM